MQWIIDLYVGDATDICRWTLLDFTYIRGTTLTSKVLFNHGFESFFLIYFHS